MDVLRTIPEVRERVARARALSETIGFVPTMGWLHQGHRALVRRASSECGLVVVSLFVNPTQFNDPSDLDAYPRNEQRDVTLSAEAGAGLLFAPSVGEVYPAGFATTVAVRGLTDVLEGASRGAQHFHGVTTVVAKLLNIVRPDVAYFGQKDAQQSLVVRRMVRDLDFPVRIEVCPTVREPDGLALSSRNVRLSADDRPRAVALRRGLDAAAGAVARGERDARAVERAGVDAMTRAGVRPEYFAVVSPETLAPIVTLASGDTALIAVAAPVGPVRLIDNDMVVAP
jgi:pantoate--beta-alanine ligase